MVEVPLRKLRHGLHDDQGNSQIQLAMCKAVKNMHQDSLLFFMEVRSLYSASEIATRFLKQLRVEYNVNLFSQKTCNF
uniref:Uncharacterized protein n=1 Tax=Triticum urartu TaxID=4572 RepID=A0A8R7UGX8_TRIUA